MLVRIWRLLWARVKSKNLNSLAQSLAYSTILSLVPILAIFFSILGTITQNVAIKNEIQQFISLYLIPEYVKQVFIQLERLAELSLTLGAIGFPALFVAGVFLYAKVDAGINEIWDNHKERQWFRNSLAFFMTLFLGPALLILIFSLFPYLHALPYMGLVFQHRLIKPIIAFLIPVVVSGAGLSLLYFYIPVVKVRLKAAVWGGVLASLMIQGANALLGYYFSHVSHLDVVYGSLVTFPIILIWLFGVWLVVLAGAALTFVLQYHQSSNYKWVENLYNDESTLNNALSVLLLLANAFSQGEPPMDVEQLHFKLNIHTRRLEFILGRLVRYGFLVALAERPDQVGGQTYQVARSLDLMRLNELQEIFYQEKKHQFFASEQGLLLNRLAVHPAFGDEDVTLETLVRAPSSL